MKKNIIITTIIIIIISIVFYYNKIQIKKKYTIAIIQCASNKSLDILANSFINKINTLLNNSVNIVYKNIEGSESQGLAISQQLFYNKDINLFFTIGSMPAQLISKLEKERPIIIAGISDPYSYNLNKNNICGTIDAINEKELFNMITKTTLNTRKIGILRTAGDINEKEFQSFKLICKENNILVIDYPINNESEIISITQKACQNVDSLIIPCDSLVVSALSYIIKISENYKIPLFTCFAEGASLGAYCSIGTNYIQNGAESAEIANKIILEKIPLNLINFKKTSYGKIYCNKKIKKQLKINKMFHNLNLEYI
jgi:putative ABC transport system substrate-binding protein